MSNSFYDSVFLVPSAHRAKPAWKRRLPNISAGWWLVPSLVSYALAAVIIFR